MKGTRFLYRETDKCSQVLKRNNGVREGLLKVGGAGPCSDLEGVLQ